MAKISTINTNNIDISKTETLVNTSNTDNIYSSINTLNRNKVVPTKTTVTTVKNEGPEIGRNEPCPCGSGKKYKNCCGKNA